MVHYFDDPDLFGLRMAPGDGSDSEGGHEGGGSGDGPGGGKNGR